jgi:hypothetical protein
MTEVVYSPKIKPEHLARKAIVYLRQSSEKQVRQNTESASSMRWPNVCALWAGSRSRSSIVTWDRARALPPPSGKVSNASSAW